jgi:hypothetical protein
MKSGVTALALSVVFSGGLFRAAPLHAAEVDLEVTANRAQIYIGEAVILSVKVSGSSEELEPDLEGLERCRIRRLGSQNISNYSIMIVNGQITRQGFSGRIYTYEVTPLLEGDFQAGPVKLKVGGQELSAPGPVIRVTGIEKQDLVDIRVEASRTPVLVDEAFEIVLRVRVKRLPGNWAQTEPLFPGDPPALTIPYLEHLDIDGLKPPDVNRILNGLLAADPRQPGLAINQYMVRNNPFDFSNPFNMANPFEERKAKFKLESSDVVVDGKPYLEYRLALTYTPEKEGNYTFGPVVFKGPVAAMSAATPEPAPQVVFTVGPAATIRVIPPPEENRPDSYIGAIGSNLTVEAALDAQTCNVGDPLKLTLTVGGSIQMRNIYPPHLSLQTNLLDHFTIYEDNIQTIKTDGRQQFVYILRPTAPGTLELPPLAVSFYDVNTRHYQTVYSPALPVCVYRAAQVTASQIVGRTNAARAKQAEIPAAPAALRLDPAGAEPASLTGGWRTLAWGSAGPLIWAGAGAFLYWRRSRGRRAAARRRKHAASRAITRLNRLGNKPPHDPQAGHRQIRDALRQYLADRFDLSGASLTPDDARRILAAQRMPADLKSRFEAALERHFNAAFQTAGADVPGSADECRRLVMLIQETDHRLASQVEPHPHARV